MKKTLLLAVAAASMAVYAQSVDDSCISFCTAGPDRYSDGTVVLDGECYALVWSRDGTFDGFTADGECVDSGDRLVLVAAVAKDGRCPPVLFQFPADEMKLSGIGRYSVCLLDTRVSENGAVRPNGAVDGRLELLNGYGEVSATVKSVCGTDSFSLKETPAAGSGQVAGKIAGSRPSSIRPKIKGVRVEGDSVNITVENLGGYMRVHSGGDVKSFTTTGPATKTSGEPGDVVLSVPKTGPSGFFKIIHSE